MSQSLLDSLDCRRWLFSTNGAVFGHPDPEAVARVILYGGSTPTLLFNSRSPTTRRWADPRLLETYGYETVYPTVRGAGVTVDV